MYKTKKEFNKIVALVKLGYRRGKLYCFLPRNRFTKKFLPILKRHSLILSYTRYYNFFLVKLSFSKQTPLIKDLKLHTCKNQAKGMPLWKLKRAIESNPTRVFLLLTQFGIVNQTEAFRLKSGGILLLSFL